MADVKLWLQEHYLPVVLVVATPAADAIAATKNGLDIADILRPYSTVPQLNVSMRVGELAWRVPDLRLRFHAASTAFQPRPEVFEAHLQELLHTAAIKYAKMEQQPEILQPQQPGGSVAMIEELTPWFSEYREEFMRMLRFGDHETLDYPVACIYVIPCDAPNVTSHFQALQAGLAPLPLVSQEAMPPLRDPEVPKHFVLLQDGSECVDERKVQDNLAAAHKAYGELHCSLLKINTARGDKQGAGAPAEFFRRFQRPVLAGGGAGEPEVRLPVPPQGLGTYLSSSDLDGLSAFVRTFTTSTLLPRLEERAARLNTGITATRRGLRNRLTRFWKPASGDAATSGAASENQPYPHHTIESQMRQLADLAFLLHQYDFAASLYRLAAQDYLGNGNNKWYAGAEEMIGLCCVLDLGDGNDPLKYFSRAYDHYSKMPGKGGRVLATRCMLLCAAYQRSVGRHLSASHVLMRAHFEEENARAALLLEQAAYALLALQPPSTRKFAFQMVLAGLRYHSCGQKRLAINAYRFDGSRFDGSRFDGSRQVMGVYHGKLWRSIDEHLNDVLGKQCREAGDVDRALWHFKNLLECSHRPAATQQHYLTQFLDAVRKAQLARAATSKDSAVLVLDTLELPLFNCKDVRIAFDDQACHGNAAAQAVPDAAWLHMEAAVAGDGSGGTNWLEGGKQLRDHEEFNVCVAGEEVSVNIELRNPLHVKLRVSAVRLMCAFTPLDAVPSASAVGTMDIAVVAPVAAATQSAAATAVAAAVSAAAPPSLLEAGPLGPPIEHKGEAKLPSVSHPLADNHPPRRCNEQMSLFIQDDKFTLHPGEVLLEQLRVRPLVPGWLRITGVQWLLNDVVEGRALFDVKGKRRKNPKGARPGQQKHFPPSRRLLFSVIAAMPRLEVVADDVPQQLYQGELCCVSFTLRNAGTLPLRNLQLVLGHPEVACPTSSTSLRQPLLTALQDPKERVLLERLPAASQGHGLQRVCAWPGRELQPGEQLEWPIWLHPRGVGMLRFNSVWYCEPTVPVSTMKCRTLRLSYAIQVMPLLALRPSIAITPRDLYAYKLRLEMENGKDGDAVDVRQITCLSRGLDVGWRLAHAPPAAAGPSAAAVGMSDAAPAAAAGCTICPAVTLQPGESYCGNFQLLPPQALLEPRPVLLSCSDGAAVAAEDGPSSSYSPPAGALDFERSGILSWFYQEQQQQQQQQAPLEGASTPSSNSRGVAGPVGVIGATGRALQQPTAAAAVERPAGAAAAASIAVPKAAVPSADPPVDVLVTWRVAASSQPGMMGRDRLGVCRLRDLCSAVQGQPIRLMLFGSSTVRHDFRQGAVCVLRLRLLLRNCCTAKAKLQIEVGEGWQGPEVHNAWAQSLSPLSSGSPHQQGVSGATPLPPPITYQAGLAPSTEYVWCGKTYVNIPALAPGEAAGVPLQVAVFRPGMYAVSGYRCTYILESPSVIDTQRGETFLVKVEAI